MSYQLIEVLKSSDSHNKWDDVAISLRGGFKDQGDKINQISKSLMVINSYINKNGRPLSLNRDKPTEYIKMICKQKNLIYSETPRNGLNCLELSGECFRVVIVMPDVRVMQVSPKADLIKQVLIEYNKEKPTNCPELQKSLSEGDYSPLLLHIEELLQLYSVGNDRAQQLKAFLCLQSLEEDINKLAQCQIVPKSTTDSGMLLPQPNNIIGTIKPRSGGIPSQFLFYSPRCVTTTDNYNTTIERFNIMVQLMPHNENNLLPFIPLVNLQKDSKGNCSPSYVTADSLKCVSLAAKFVLKLSHPLVLSETNMMTITSITGLNVIVIRDRCNYVDLLLEQAGSSLTHQDRFYSILLNDKQIAFQIPDDSASFNGHVVVSIPFLLPSQLPRIVAILKKQAIINTMMESFLLTNAKMDFDRDCHGAQPINITLLSHDELICSFSTSGSKIKFSILYNEYGQSIVNLISPRKSDSNQMVNCSPEKVTQKYNNLPMIIFWLLHKCGDATIKESATFMPDSVPSTDQQTLSDLTQNENDCKFAKECLASARASLRIRSANDREIFPPIRIEPKVELLTTTYQQQIVNSPSLISHHDITNSIANKLLPQMSGSNHEQAHLQTQDYQGSYQNPYLQHQVSCHIPGQSNNIMSANGMGQLPAQSNQSIKNEQYQSYASHGNKHMSLDQMLSSDFAMPFASDGIGQFNPLAHSMHYQEHSNNPQTMNNVYGSHMGNFKESPNSKPARQTEMQSSVLVNLLNNNENSSSVNSSLLSRQMSASLNAPCFPPNAYLSDQLDSSKNLQSQMLRGSQIPRLRMPHPNQVPKPNLGPNYSQNMSSVPSLPINRLPPPSQSSSSSASACKSDILMMPYPQDTGTIRGTSTRKPRKRRAPNLELNQRLPKLQTSQFPMIQQPTPTEAMHMSNMQLTHLQQASNTLLNQSQSSSSNASFSSPTTMDQSVYDFDDNVEFSRIRTMSSNSSISPHSANTNNNPNRRVAGSGSKKPLKVKISRKIIAQNSSVDQSVLESQLSGNYESDLKIKEKAASMCRSNTMPNISNIILSAPSSTSSANTVIGITTTASGVNHSNRPTAIMSAIDSPVTCSSMSSMQASPYSSQHNLPGTLENCDGTEIKKRRKRRLKLDQGEDAESVLKREKLEARKQNRKKKEMGSVSGMSSHGSMENLSSLINDSNLKPPLPIKLSVNTKMGSVSNSGVGAGVRNPKTMTGTSSPVGNQTTAGPWNVQNNNAQIKPSTKELKASAEPILRNYKIPKKKASDSHQSQESMHGLFGINSNLHKTTIAEHANKSSTDCQELMKSEMSTMSSSVSFIERPKSPDLMSTIMPITTTTTNTSTITPQNNDHDQTKGAYDNQFNSCAPKGKKIHEIVDMLKAKSGNTVASNTESSVLSNPVPMVSDLSQLKLSEFNQTCSENIFDKFSPSKSSSKADYRQFPNNRFPDPSMSVPRYPYNRAPSVYPPRVPVAASSPFNYGARQPYINNNNNNNNANCYRMETVVPRNFAPTNPGPVQYQKKNGNNTAFLNRKK